MARIGGARSSLTVLAGLLAAAVVTHAPALVAGYVQDDHVAIESNPVVARGDVLEILTSSYWKGAQGDDRALYRPVAIGSYAVERRLVGEPSPALSHAVNLLLHGMTAILLAVWARRLGVGALAAALAGALFAVHPAHSEAVYNVVGRAEILACLFTISGLLIFTYTAAWPGDPAATVRPGLARAASWGSALCLFLAAASKEGGIVLLALLPIQEILFRPPPRGNATRWLVDRAAALAPCGAAIVVWLALRAAALEAFFPLQSLPPFDNPLVAMSPGPRLFTALGLVTRYAGRIVFPAGLSNDYSGPVIAEERSVVAPLPLLGVASLALAGVAAAAAFSPRSAERMAGTPLPLSASPTRRRVALGACLALASYLVTANLLFPVGASMAERFLYTPMAGIALAAGAWIDRGLASPRLRRIVIAAPAAALVALSLACFVRGFDWRSDRTIFSAAIRTTPRSPRSHFALGKLLTRTESDAPVSPERLREAIGHFRAALALWPDYDVAKLELGLALARLGDLDAAEPLFRDVLRRIPEDGTCHYNLGLVLDRRGRRAEAERSFRKAVLFDPDLDRAWASLGHLTFDEGRFADAERAYARAVALGREDLRARWSESKRRASGPPAR